MLLNGYREEISRPTCNNTFRSLHCIAYLDEDISEALPYLDASLGGDAFIRAADVYGVRFACDRRSQGN